MIRAGLRGAIGAVLILSASARADNWQPITPEESMPSVVATPLGKPIAASAALPCASQEAYQAPSSSQIQDRTAKLGSPQTIVRAKGPDGPPLFAASPPYARPHAGAVDERFACGEVVAEGPPGGRGWTGPSTSHTWLGNIVAAPVDWVKSWGLSFQSDHRFDDAGFISPTTNPFFFEDPRSLTEIRPILIYEKSPAGNPLLNGGNTFFFGLQGRVAFSEYFSLVLHKLGGIRVSSDGLVPDATDFAEIWLGGKFTFYADPATCSAAAFGLNFELPVGGGDAFQDTGNGAITPYLTYAQQLWTNFHFIGAIGYRIGFNDERSDSLFLSLHLDYNIAGLNKFFPFVEFHWFHYTSNGTTTPVSNEGRDLYNFGATNVSGNDIVTMAVGMRFKLTPGIEFGAAYEFPISNREDLIKHRVSLDVIFRY